MKGNQMNLFNKVVMITGGVTGIGREITVNFARLGAKIAICDINREKGDELLKEIEKLDAQAIYIDCNVNSEHDVTSTIKHIVDTFGRLDIACNDAGIEGKISELHLGDIENFNEVINTNLRGVWLCMKHQVHQMLQNGGGSIVNISSIAGLVGFSGSAPYVASKHGVIGLTKTAALEYAQRNIRVNAICPGPIYTEMLQRIMDTNPNFKSDITNQVPMHRIGEVSEVANAVTFLASSQASYITGQALSIDGGWTSK